MTEETHISSPCCHAEKKAKPDFLLWGSALSIVLLYLSYFFDAFYLTQFTPVNTLAATVFELVHTMWWGVLIGIMMVAILGKIPREFVVSILGRNGGFSGILRATFAGLLLDLCSHGILMVGAKLYERGATAGQVIAFLVASPWNSFSLTLILIALVGIKWTLAFILLSMIIAVTSGLLFDLFVKRGHLPSNPNKIDLSPDFQFWPEAIKGLRGVKLDNAFFSSLVTEGLKGSRPVLRWILFGIVLAALVRAFVDAAHFEAYFGPTLLGLGLTVLAATIMEVCSEGSTPIASDLLNRANAPGNSFAFLMAGVATDYTEIMILRETARSWKFALFLPLITLPQVLVIAWLMNGL